MIILLKNYRKILLNEVCKKSILLFFLPSCVVTCIYAQLVQNNYSIHAEAMNGNTMTHTKHLQNMVKGPAKGIGLSAEWQTCGDKQWHHDYHFPKYGINVSYINLSNPDTLGNAITVSPYIKIHMLRTKAFNAYLKLNGGAAYITKKYTHYEGLPFDRSNTAFGSHINAYLGLTADAEFRVNDNWHILAGYGLRHFSNGNVKSPNSGVNILMGSLGISYASEGKFSSFAKPPATEGSKSSYTLDISLSGGIRQRYFMDTRRFGIGAFRVALQKPVSRIYSIGISIDNYYDGIYTNKDNTVYGRTYITEDKFSDKIRTGISLQNDVTFGKFTAGIHTGVYLYNPIKNKEPYAEAKNNTLKKKGIIYPYNIEKEDGWFYTHGILKYAINKNFYAVVGLKTHLYKAEFIDWGIGARL